MWRRCRSFLLGILMASCAAGALAASFPPWRFPEAAPPAAPPLGCNHERVGGWVGGTLGGWIGSRMGRHHADRDNDGVAAAAFGAVFGYWLGTEIGRSMDRGNPRCPNALPLPPRGTVSTAPPLPAIGI